MAETATQPGLFGSLQWAPTTDCQFDTAVGEAIASHCTEAGIAIPPDEAFQCAAWFLPVGTELESPEWAGYFGRASAPALRVEFANGLGVVLLIGWSDRCGCGTCAGLPSLRVVDVRPAPQPPEIRPTVGEVLGGAVVALCFVILIPFLGLFFQ